MATSNRGQVLTSETSGIQSSNDLRTQISTHSAAINGVRVGENREHFSLLQSSRRQVQQRPPKLNYSSTKVSSVVAGSEPTSGDEDEEEDRLPKLNILTSMLTKNRMMSYCRLIRTRRPKGKAVFLVLAIAFLETFSFFGALTGVKRLLPVDRCDHDCQLDWESFILSLLYSSAGRIFYPVAGVIADSYLGRYHVIHIGLLLLWMGFAVNSMSFSLLHLLPTRSWARYAMAVLSVVLFSAGSGSVEATIIPFGVDQLTQGVSSDEISSYFYYYYIIRNVAGLVATLVLFLVFDKISSLPGDISAEGNLAKFFNINCHYVIQNLLAILAVSVALLVLWHFSQSFYLDRQHSNALKSVTRVLCFAARVKRQLPKRNRAFRYGGGWTPRIDLAKIENDGTFTGEEVEEVKTFYRMLLLILSLFGYFITYGAGFAYMSSTLSKGAAKLIESRQGRTLHYLATNVIWIINTGSISIVLPIVNHLLIPLWPTINIRMKIGVGFLLHVLSFGVVACIQWRQHHLGLQSFFYLMVLAMVLLSVGETTVFVSSLEFIYAQSPNNMKGLQMGMFYLIYGIFSAVGSSLYYGSLVHWNSDRKWSIFCFILLSIGSVGLVVYIVAARCYKNRQRPATDEDATQRILMYANVYGSKT